MMQRPYAKLAFPAWPILRIIRRIVKEVMDPTRLWSEFIIGHPSGGFLRLRVTFLTFHSENALGNAYFFRAFQ